MLPVLFHVYQFCRDRQAGGVSTEDGVPAQFASLGRTVLLFAKNSDNIEAILPNVQRIAHKHVSRGIKPEQYKAIGECLLFAIGDVLGDMATEAMIAAWTDAYTFLADTFISTETDLRESLANRAGFDGMVDMRISSKNDEGCIGFVPLHHDVPPYSGGQFVAIVINELMTSMPLTKGSPNEITIKMRKNKEQATLALLNAKVGDVLKVSMPCGKAL